MGWNSPPSLTGKTTSQEDALVHCVSSPELDDFLMVLFNAVHSHLSALGCSWLSLCPQPRRSRVVHQSLAAATRSKSSLSQTDEPWLCPARQPEGNPQESQLPRCESTKEKSKITSWQFAESWWKALMLWLWFPCQPHVVSGCLEPAEGFCVEQQMLCGCGWGAKPGHVSSPGWGCRRSPGVTAFQTLSCFPFPLRPGNGWINDWIVSVLSKVPCYNHWSLKIIPASPPSSLYLNISFTKAAFKPAFEEKKY